MPHKSPESRSTPWSAFVTFLVGALVVALVLALWQAREAVLLAFAAAVFSVVLLAIARPIEQATGLGRQATLLIAAIVLIAVLTAFTMLIGSELQAQFSQLRDALPNAMENIERRFGIDLEQVAAEAGGVPSSGAGAGGGAGQLRSLPDLVGIARTAMGNILSAGTLVFNALASLIVVVVGGFFLALDPKRYRRGIVLLFPEDRHQQADAALRDCGHALHLWLLAQLLAMVLVGTLSGIGAWLIGLPAPLAIGVFAGLTEFVPIVGPWVGAVPALLLAASGGLEMVLWTAALFLGVQQLEANIISPVVQQRMADVPPFLVLFGVIALGLLFGVVGVIVSAPLTIVGYVLVTKLYIRDTLGQDVPVPGRGEG